MKQDCSVLAQHRWKWAVRRFLARRGYDIRKAPLVVDFLRSRRVDLVLDVGANIGQFAHELRAMGYRGSIMSFEPLRSAREELEAAAAKDPLWSVRASALGAEAGAATLNVTDHSAFSSIKPQTRRGERFSPRARVIGAQSVEVVRLDDIWPEFAGRRVFLKIDTQGFEQQVLKGARTALREIVGVQLELPIEHLYAETWSLIEAIGFMEENGFAISQARPVNPLREDPASLVELDVVFRRQTPRAQVML